MNDGEEKSNPFKLFDFLTKKYKVLQNIDEWKMIKYYTIGGIFFLIFILILSYLYLVYGDFFETIQPKWLPFPLSLVVIFLILFFCYFFVEFGKLWEKDTGKKLKDIYQTKDVKFFNKIIDVVGLILLLVLIIYFLIEAF